MNSDRDVYAGASKNSKKRTIFSDHTFTAQKHYHLLIDSSNVFVLWLRLHVRFLLMAVLAIEERPNRPSETDVP